MIDRACVCVSIACVLSNTLIPLGMTLWHTATTFSTWLHDPPISEAEHFAHQILLICSDVVIFPCLCSSTMSNTVQSLLSIFTIGSLHRVFYDSLSPFCVWVVTKILLKTEKWHILLESQALSRTATIGSSSCITTRPCFFSASSSFQKSSSLGSLSSHFGLGLHPKQADKHLLVVEALLHPGLLWCLLRKHTLRVPKGVCPTIQRL